VEGSGRGIFEAPCPEGFQQNCSPVPDLNPADSHVNMLTLSTTTFWPQKCYCWTLSWKDMIIKWLFGLPCDKISARLVITQCVLIVHCVSRGFLMHEDMILITP